MREGQNAVVVQDLRQAAEARLQAMEVAVNNSLAQQQELYSSIHSMTGQFMEQKGNDFAELQVHALFTTINYVTALGIRKCCWKYRDCKE